MSAPFNILLHGEAAEAAAILSGDHLPDELSATQVLRAALTNALHRIDRLEQMQSTVEVAVGDGLSRLAEARCPDCGTATIEEAIGQVCNTCHRGVIK